jgi:putative membrane protein
VAVIFGLVNAIIKPIVKNLRLQLLHHHASLIALVVNARCSCWWTGWLTCSASVQWDGFWSAFWGAIIVGSSVGFISLLIPRPWEGKTND